MIRFLLAVLFVFTTAATAQELRIGLASEPTAMDPHYHNLSPNNSLLSHIFESLVGQDERQRLTPDLAESWKPIDPTTWEFKLRKNVRFHDGTPFTADDVIFSFERAPNVEGSPSSFGIYARGKTFVKVDDHTVHVKTAAPSPLMPNDLSQVFIISRKHGQGAKTPDYNSGKAAIGTGPYRFVEYTPGNRIVVQRTEQYWGEKPLWQRVIFRGIKSDPSRVAALLAGDVDMIDEVPAVDMERLKKDPKLTIAQTVSNRIIYLHLDHFRDDSPFVRAKDGGAIKNPLRDVRVRKAVSMAIDRDAIVSFGSFLSRSMSTAGTSSIMSTSPASSAATREGSDLMPRKITRCHSGFSPQYCSFLCITMRLPGVYSTKRYGPVPIAALPEL
ncbi:MAG TPA: ABC transporter substrate-binding protein [Burkholderiales bacterium]|nr:ABC transporter substrate-binding protein [Burkholderiales bacterium]